MIKKWEVKQLLEFDGMYRAECAFYIREVKIITLWVTVLEKKGELQIKTPDNWEINNKDLVYSLINELKFKIKERKLYV